MKDTKRRKRLRKLLFPPRQEECSQCGPFQTLHAHSSDVCQCAITWASAGRLPDPVMRCVEGLTKEENKALLDDLLAEWYEAHPINGTRPSHDLKRYLAEVSSHTNTEEA